MEDSKKLNEDQQDQNINELKFDILSHIYPKNINLTINIQKIKN